MPLVAGRRVPELLHDVLDREGAGLLARREILEADQMLCHDRLRRDEHEGMLDEPPHVVARLVLGPFERVGAQIE